MMRIPRANFVGRVVDFADRPVAASTVPDHVGGVHAELDDPLAICPDACCHLLMSFAPLLTPVLT